MPTLVHSLPLNGLLYAYISPFISTNTLFYAYNTLLYPYEWAVVCIHLLPYPYKCPVVCLKYPILWVWVGCCMPTWV